MKDNYMLVYNGVKSLVPRKIISMDEIEIKIFKIFTTDINVYKRLTSVTSTNPIPTKIITIAEECKRNKQFANEFLNILNSHINEDGNLMIVSDIDGREFFAMEGTTEIKDENNIGYMTKLEDLAFLIQFSPKLESYTDIFGNRIDFEITKIVRK